MKCSDKNESFYLQKVCFSDREKFSETLPPPSKIGKLSTTLSYGSRWKTQHNAFLWVALENSAQRFPMGRVGKLSTTLSYGSRCG
ncbi:PF11689 family protein, partial [Leptospira interrogans serovar Pyrogenes str. 2006006960]